MDLDRARRARQIFGDLVDLPANERTASLERVCGDDAALRRDVESLLAANANAGEFLETGVSAEGCAPTGAAEEMVGRKIGSFTILRPIGAGGMGVVYEAQQAAPHRIVALKLMRAGFASPERARRFVLEAEVLGRLQHSGVAQVFESGVHHEVGVAIPYFAMEYVPGAVAITEFSRRRGLTLRDRLNLFLKVCDAVEHGHQRGVIHRDLKPGNILVDASGQPKVIDFGVARLSSAEAAELSLRTGTGQFVGTLRYMSPEQCGGSEEPIDTRTDVYSLGVVLYELLCETTPYDVRSSGVFEIPRAIREQEPRRISSLDRTLRGDIETIVHKALEKDRERRYPSVGEFAQDIRRHLAGEPIEARRASGLYVLRKSLVRHRSAVFVAATIFAIVLGAAIALGILFRTADSQRRIAVERAEALRQSKYFADISLAQAALAQGDGARMLRHLQGCPADLRDWEWSYLNRQRGRSRLAAHVSSKSLGAAFSPAGDRIVAWGEDGRVRLLDGQTLARVGEWEAGVEPISAAAISPDGRLVASASYDRFVRVRRVEDGAEIAAFLADNVRAASVAFSRDGQLLAAGGWDDRVRLWDTSTGLSKEELTGGGGFALRFHPDGERLLGIAVDGSISEWHVATRRLLRKAQVTTRQPSAFALSPDGGRFAVAVQDRDEIRLVSTATFEDLAQFDRPGRVQYLDFSPDGARLAVASTSISVIDVSTGRFEPVRIGDDRMSTVQFSPDGSSLLTAGYDEQVRLWTAKPEPEPRVLQGHTDMVRAVVAFPDGRRIGTASRDGTIRIWDVRSGKVERSWTAHDPRDPVLAINSTGTLLASGGFDRRLRLWNPDSGKEVGELPDNVGAIIALDFSPDGAMLASISQGGEVILWSVQDRTRRCALRTRAPRLLDVRVSPDGRSFALSTGRGCVEIRDAETTAVQAILERAGETLQRLTYSPDGRLLAASSEGGPVYVWDTATGELRNELRGHTFISQGLAFLPGGSRLFSSGYDGVIHVWDLRTGGLALTLTGHEGGIPGLAISPDGSWLASASNDRSVRVWTAVDPPETE